MARDAYTFRPSVGRDALWPSGRPSRLPGLNLVDAPQPVRPREADSATGAKLPAPV